MIKHFIYLDEYKMYSLSSQIFEGITEYLITTDSNIKSEDTSQKGPVGSGRILADILRKENETTEKRYLHDYSYVLFEKYLIEKEYVLDVNNASSDNIEDAIGEHSFIKVKGKARFNDMESLKDTLKNFNNIGKALAHVSNYQNIEEARKQLDQMKANIKDRNQRAKLQGQLKRLTNVDKLAKETGLQQDKEFLKNLLTLTFCVETCRSPALK